MDSIASACHIRTMRTLVALVLGAAACSSPTPGQPDAAATETTVGGSGAAQPDTTGAPVTGTYNVPVTDPSLAAAAMFTVAVKVKAIQGGLELHYDLPITLVGVPFQSVKLQVLDTTAQLSLGKDVGQASCTQANQQITCQETLPAINVDLQAVRDAAVAEGLTPMVVEQRVAVASGFSIDPIGVFAVQIPSASGTQSGRGP